MKKIKFWSLMLGLTFGSLAFVACGDDKEDSNTTPPTENNGGDNNGNGGNGDDGNTPAPVTLVGTWKCSHVGEDGTGVRETIVVGQDQSYSASKTLLEITGTYDINNNWVTKLNSYDYRWVGTWRDSLGFAVVTTTEYFKWDHDQNKQVKDEDFKPSSNVFYYSAYGNGIVAWGFEGGIDFFTKDGVARQLPSLANHELCGRWESVQPWGDGYNENLQYYQFNADGTVEQGSIQRHIENQEVFQAFRSVGIYAPIEGQMKQSVAGIESSAGTKLFSFIEDTSSVFETVTGTGKWKPSSGRHGGHPMKYELKDGKLYIGVITMDPEYFYKYGFVKK